MPISFDQNCLHFTFQPYLSFGSFLNKYEKLPNKVNHWYQKSENDFVKKVWPAHLAFFINVTIQYVKTVKKLDRLRCERSRVRYLALARCFMFAFFLLLLWFYSLVQNTLYVMQFCNSIRSDDRFSFFELTAIFWPNINVLRYRPSIFKTYKFDYLIHSRFTLYMLFSIIKVLQHTRLQCI